MLAESRERVGPAGPAHPRRGHHRPAARRRAPGSRPTCCAGCASMAFAAGMHVFPGGRVDPADTAAHVGWFGTRPRGVGASCSAPMPRSPRPGLRRRAGDVRGVRRPARRRRPGRRRRRLRRRVGGRAARPASSVARACPACSSAAASACAPTCCGPGRTGSPRRSSPSATTPASSSPRCRRASTPATSAARPTPRCG